MISNHNKELLNDPVFLLPQQRNQKLFIPFLTGMFKRFIKKIDKFEGEIGEKLRDRQKLIEQECSFIIKSLEQYYQGYPSMAFSTFADGMNSISEILWIPKEDDETSFVTGEYTYRARPLDQPKMFSVNEMFHVPFENRHKISSQRFSIPGFPCLYLGNSVYTCWIENNMPEFKNMAVSRYDASSCKFLVLNESLQSFNVLWDVMANTHEHWYDMIIEVISNWPLMAACSIRKMGFEDTPRPAFIAEYIIPQMVMEWIRVTKEVDVDGVSYYSTHYSADRVPLGMMTNYALPAKRIAETGYCSYLTEKLKLTEPVTYKHIEDNGPYIKLTEYEAMVAGSNTPIDTLREKGMDLSYFETQYGKLEVTLMHLPLITRL